MSGSHLLQNDVKQYATEIFSCDIRLRISENGFRETKFVNYCKIKSNYSIRPTHFAYHCSMNFFVKELSTLFCANCVFHKPSFQVLRCRQLLSICPHALASPQLADKALIDAVVHVEFYKKKFGLFCRKLNLKVSNNHQVKPIFDRSSTFTLVA